MVNFSPTSHLRIRHVTETVVRKCSVKKVLLKILQNSQENTCARNSSTSNNKHEWTHVKYLNVLHHNRIQRSRNNFSEYNTKILPTSYFGHFEHVWLLPSKRLISTCRNFDVYLHARNDLHS